MLQIQTTNYASDALEDAMRLAQTKALNSYTFSDCLNYLNYTWSDIYSRMAAIDSGYYSKTIRLTQKLTKLPPCVKSSVKVYAAQRPVGFDRIIFRQAGQTDLMASNVYKISGTDLFCADAERRTVWLEYVPQPAQIFFTQYNRDPKILSEGDYTLSRSSAYSRFKLIGQKPVESNGEPTYIDIDVSDTNYTETDIASCQKWLLRDRGDLSDNRDTDITDSILKCDFEEIESPTNTDINYWKLTYISCDFPYIFCTYTHNVTGEHISGFYDRELGWNQFNPFAFTGRNSDVSYISCKWNDKTGMGVVIADYNDLDTDGNPIVKEIGWTPDTRLDYPCPEMYRYLVARLADKFSALNESNVMGVQLELAEARYAFESLLNKDKSAWSRINNVNPATLGDWL